MRRTLRAIVGLTFFATMLLVVPSSAAASGTSGCGTTFDDFGRVIASACAGGAAGSGAVGVGTPGAPSGPRECTFGPDVVPCVTSAGTWNGACYDRIDSPQPPLADPLWLGNADGVIMACSPPSCVLATGGVTPGCPMYRYWAAAPPAGVAIDEPTAARRAIAQLDLDPITVTMAPKPNLADPNVLIGAPAFFWAEGGTPAIGPLATTVTQDGLTISLQATLDHVTFDTGDGGSVTCTRDQIEHAPAHMDFDVIPECGHTWLHPGVLTLSATSAWTITWQGPTQSGTLDHTLDASIDVAITDRPVNLTTNG